MTRKNGNGTDLSDEQATDIVKQKRKRNRPDLANFGQEYIEPGDNARYIAFNMKFWNLPKLDFTDIPAVQKRIDMYFQMCFEEDMKPGVAGLAYSLGVNRRTLWEWKTGGRRESTPELADTIKKAYAFLELLWEQYMQNGKISPPNGIFLGKNNFDYRDETQVVVTPNNPLQGMDADTARQRLVEAIPADDDENE